MCEYYTHRTGGLLAGALVLQFYHVPPELWPGALLLSVIASSVPDLDHTQSAAQSASMNELRNNVPVAGNLFGWLLIQGLKVARKVLGKREATHSFLFAALPGGELTTYGREYHHRCSMLPGLSATH